MPKKTTSGKKRPTKITPIDKFPGYRCKILWGRKGNNLVIEIVDPFSIELVDENLSGGTQAETPQLERKEPKSHTVAYLGGRGFWPVKNSPNFAAWHNSGAPVFFGASFSVATPAAKDFETYEDWQKRIKTDGAGAKRAVREVVAKSEQSQISFE